MSLQPSLFASAHCSLSSLRLYVWIWDGYSLVAWISILHEFITFEALNQEHPAICCRYVVQTARPSKRTLVSLYFDDKYMICFLLDERPFM